MLAEIIEDFLMFIDLDTNAKINDQWEFRLKNDLVDYENFSTPEHLD